MFWEFYKMWFLCIKQWNFESLLVAKVSTLKLLKFSRLEIIWKETYYYPPLSFFFGLAELFSEIFHKPIPEILATSTKQIAMILWE